MILIFRLLPFLSPASTGLLAAAFFPRSKKLKFLNDECARTEGWKSIKRLYCRISQVRKDARLQMDAGFVFRRFAPLFPKNSSGMVQRTRIKHNFSRRQSKLLEVLCKKGINNALIVMGNVSFHRTMPDSMPNWRWSLSQLQDYCNAHGFATDDNTSKTAIFLIARQHVPRQLYPLPRRANQVVCPIMSQQSVYNHKIIKLGINLLQAC
jgi:hypothetical protein